jgi:hypothetical protein
LAIADNERVSSIYKKERSLLGAHK